jgi:D-serine deaminase-like pyridoxal phosphate-dependent protein
MFAAACGAGNMTDVLAVLETPALVVDLEMLEANLAEMAAIAGSNASS